MTEVDRERSLDGDADGADPEDRRLAGLLAIALDAHAAMRARTGVLAAIEAIGADRRRLAEARIRRHIGPPRWPWFGAAAVFMIGVALVLFAPGWRNDVVLPDGTRLLTVGDAAWSWSSENGDTVVDLDRGRIDIEAARQPPGCSLLVRTAVAEARVVGTQFAVTSAATGTTVSVASGRVHVTGRRIAGALLGPSDRLLVPAPGGWTSRITATGDLRADPIAWWLGERGERDGRSALIAAPGEEPTWSGVRARLRGTYRIGPGDRLRIELHARRPLQAVIQAECPDAPASGRFAATTVALREGDNRIDIPWQELTGSLPPHRPLAAGDGVAVLAILTERADGPELAVRALELVDPGP